MHLVLGNLSFTNAAVPKGIRENQALVEGRISQGGHRSSPIQGLKRDASLLAVLVWPDGNRLVPLSNEAAERLGGIRRGNAA